MITLPGSGGQRRPYISPSPSFSSHAITCHQRRSAHEEQDVRRFRGPSVTSKQQQTRWWPVPTGLNIRVDTPLLGEIADLQSLCKSCASYRREWPGWRPSTSLGLPKALRHCSGSLDDSSNFHRRPSDRSPFRSLRSSMFIWRSKSSVDQSLLLFRSGKCHLAVIPTGQPQP